MSRKVERAYSAGGSFKESFHVGLYSTKASRHAPSLHHGTCRAHHGCSHESYGYHHGGPGGKRASKHSLGQGFAFRDLHGSGHDGWKSSGSFHVNEKETMQHLNDRLASYMDMVHSLEEQNNKLERKIKEWYEKNTPSTFPNFNNFYRIINELQSKILDEIVGNANLVLYVDNARLTADDFQNKYNMELCLRNNIDGDVSGLRRGLDGFTLEKCNLELQLEHLQEDLLHMKKNHEEEVTCLRAQLGARVSVEVDAAPSADLGKFLSEIRDEYEKLMDRNIKEVETWFFKQSEELNNQVTSGAEQLQSVKSEVIDLRRTAQTLEIEFQAQQSTNIALEGTLEETELGYSSQLRQLQVLINNVEAELAEIRCDLECQIHEYKILMDLKSRLEMEIATYRRLLEGEDIQVPRSRISEGKGLKIVSITEEFENGKIVSTREQIHKLKC